MLFYAVGSGLDAMAATATCARSGWLGVCAQGAGVSLVALLFWGASLHYMETAAPRRS